MWNDHDGEEALEIWRAGEDPHLPVDEDGDAMCAFCLEPYPCAESLKD